jgi:hypothetical protein
MTGGVTGPGGYTAPPPSTLDPNALPLPGGAGGAGTSTVDSAKLLADMLQLVQGMNAKTPGGAPGVTTSSGAPSIDGVTIDFSPEDMAAALLVLQGKTSDAQISTAKQGVDISKKKMEQKNTEAMAKIKDWIQKCEEAAAKEKSGGILGWFTKIASFIGAALAVVAAAVATAATGGAAAPLLALAIVGMVGATISLASAISQECGGPPLEISTWMAKACTEIMKAVGVPADKAEAAGKVMAGAAALMLCPALIAVDPSLMGNLAGGIAELSGADASTVAIVTGVLTAVTSLAISIGVTVASGGMGATAAVSDTVALIGKAAKISQAVVGVATGAAAVGKGVITLEAADLQKQADGALVDKKKIDAILAKLQKQMEDDRDQIKKVLDDVMQGMTIVSQMISAASSSRSQIAGNLVGKSQTI